MSNWRLHTPEGTTDLLPSLCMKKNELENDILNVFGSYGYDAVEIPVMQFYDVYDTPSGKIEQEIMYKFFDSSGRITVLRPDITTAIARMVATKMNDKSVKRLCYCGKVFRQIDSFASGQREFCQAGIELIGAKGDEADAEVIACAIESLLSAGLEEFLVEIGQVEFFKGLAEESKLSQEEIEELRILIDKKDCLSIREFLKGKDMEEHIKDALANLPNCFGEPEILNNIDTAKLGERANTALLNLKNVCGLLKSYGFGDYISVDLSLVKGINCYTGIMFKGITNGVGFSVCAGGRYDTLLGEYGCDMPAVGMSVGTDRILNVLESMHDHEHKVASDILVYSGTAEARYKIATALRNCGYVVEIYYGDTCPKKFAEENGIGGALKVISEEEFELYNTGDKSEILGKLSDLSDGGTL